MPPRHFLDIDCIDPGTLRRILDMGHAMKKAGKRVPAKLRPPGIEDAVLMLIFEKPSTRTRVSFDVAMRQLGGQSLPLNQADLQVGRGEPISDTAKVVSRYVDAIMIRANKHQTLIELAENATVPVINGLTDRTHPCQIVADIMTFEEAKGPIRGRRIAWTGDAQNNGPVSKRCRHRVEESKERNMKRGVLFTLAAAAAFTAVAACSKKDEPAADSTGTAAVVDTSTGAAGGVSGSSVTPSPTMSDTAAASTGTASGGDTIKGRSTGDTTTRK